MYTWAIDASRLGFMSTSTDKIYYKENAMTFERYLLKSKSELVNDTKV